MREGDGRIWEAELFTFFTLHRLFLFTAFLSPLLLCLHVVLLRNSGKFSTLTTISVYLLFVFTPSFLPLIFVAAVVTCSRRQNQVATPECSFYIRSKSRRWFRVRYLSAPLPPLATARQLWTRPHRCLPQESSPFSPLGAETHSAHRPSQRRALKFNWMKTMKTWRVLMTGLYLKEESKAHNQIRRWQKVFLSWREIDQKYQTSSNMHLWCLTRCIKLKTINIPLIMKLPVVRYSPVGAVLETWTKRIDITLLINKRNICWEDFNCVAARKVFNLPWFENKPELGLKVRHDEFWLETANIVSDYELSYTSVAMRCWNVDWVYIERNYKLSHFFNSCFIQRCVFFGIWLVYIHYEHNTQANLVAK